MAPKDDKSKGTPHDIQAKGTFDQPWLGIGGPPLEPTGPPQHKDIRKQTSAVLDPSRASGHRVSYHSDGENEHQKSGQRGFSEGFMIAFLNPKILAFLIAIFSQFVQPDFTWSERALVACIAMCIDGGWYVLVEECYVNRNK